MREMVERLREKGGWWMRGVRGMRRDLVRGSW